MASHAQPLQSCNGSPSRDLHALLGGAGAGGRTTRSDAMPARVPVSRLRRDPELEEVLTRLEERLRAVERLRATSYDDELGLVERLAAPYALAFLYEIRRLDALCGELQRAPHGARK